MLFFATLLTGCYESGWGGGSPGYYGNSGYYGSSGTVLVSARDFSST